MNTALTNSDILADMTAAATDALLRFGWCDEPLLRDLYSFSESALVTYGPSARMRAARNLAPTDHGHGPGDCFSVGGPPPAERAKATASALPAPSAPSPSPSSESRHLEAGNGHLT